MKLFNILIGSANDPCNLKDPNGFGFQCSCGHQLRTTDFILNSAKILVCLLVPISGLHSGKD